MSTLDDVGQTKKSYTKICNLPIQFPICVNCKTMYRGLTWGHSKIVRVGPSHTPRGKGVSRTVSKLFLKLCLPTLKLPLLQFVRRRVIPFSVLGSVSSLTPRVTILTPTSSHHFRSSQFYRPEPRRRDRLCFAVILVPFRLLPNGVTQKKLTNKKS